MRPPASAALPAILALALLLRIGVIVATPDFFPIYDAGDYDRHARSIADGDGYPGALGTPGGPTALRPPLYPLALAAVYELGGGWTAGRLLGALLGVVTVLLVFLISRRLWGARVALVAATTAAVFPPLVVLNASLINEQLFVALVLAVLLAVLRYRDDRRLRWAALAGVLCGLAALTRSNGPFLVLATLLGVWTVRPRAPRPALMASIAVIAFSIAAVTPWVVRNTIVFDRFVGINTQGGYALAGTYNRESSRIGNPGRYLPPHRLRIFRDLYQRNDLDEAELGSRLTGRALDYISDNPGYVVETIAWSTLRVFEVVHEVDLDFLHEGLVLQAVGVGSVVSPVLPVSLYLIVTLALVGVVAELRRPPSRRAPPFVWTVPLLMLLPAVAVLGLPRYRAPVDPFLTMLAAVGLVALVRRIALRPSAARDGATPVLPGR
jgi:4-amino-4-deoxy-L-arabinose transferase-like glycosyltransferase